MLLTLYCLFQVEGSLVPCESSATAGECPLLHAIERIETSHVGDDRLDKSGKTLTRQCLLAKLLRKTGGSVAQCRHWNAREKVVQEFELEPAADGLRHHSDTGLGKQSGDVLDESVKTS